MGKEKKDDYVAISSVATEMRHWPRASMLLIVLSTGCRRQHTSLGVQRVNSNPEFTPSWMMGLWTSYPTFQMGIHIILDTEGQ